MRLSTYISELISVVGMVEVQVKYCDYMGAHTMDKIDSMQYTQLHWRSLGLHM